MKRALPDLPLPKPPESVEENLRFVCDYENEYPEWRATRAASLLVELHEWLDEFVAKADEIHALTVPGTTAADLLDVARRTHELRKAGHHVIFVRPVDDEGYPLRPAEVRPATEEEIAALRSGGDVPIPTS
jgi:hypothetical protein